MKIHHIITLRNALFMTALATALGAGQAYAAGNDGGSTSFRGSTVRKTERVVSDSWITTKVKSELMADAGTKAFDVSVKTDHGVVGLTGALPTQDSIDQVKHIAEKVKGVKSVDASALTVAAK